jgi:hypothetical protein
MTYPLETQARAALRLTAAMHVRAQAGPSLTDEPRRQSFLQVHPLVVAIADRAVFDVPDDGKDPRPEFIAALLRIAQIKTEQFARECAAFDASERKVLGEAFDFMATLTGSAELQPSTRRTVDRHSIGRVTGRMRMLSCTGETDPELDRVASLEAAERAGAGVPLPECAPEPELERMTG